MMEHSDGSAFYTKTVDNKDLFYIRSFIIDPETEKNIIHDHGKESII